MPDAQLPPNVRRSKTGRGFLIDIPNVGTQPWTPPPGSPLAAELPAPTVVVAPSPVSGDGVAAAVRGLESLNQPRHAPLSHGGDHPDERREVLQSIQAQLTQIGLGVNELLARARQDPTQL